MTCPYCGQAAELKTGAEVYPRRVDLAKRMFWVCTPCDARVGCHPGTVTPLGTPADAELRAARNAAHAAFDPLWDSGELTRTRAYAWLAERMGMRKEDVHIGHFDLAQCQRVVDECSQFGACPPSGQGGK